MNESGVHNQKLESYWQDIKTLMEDFEYTLADLLIRRGVLIGLGAQLLSRSLPPHILEEHIKFFPPPSSLFPFQPPVERGEGGSTAYG